LRDCTGGASQRWQFTYGTIVNPGTKRCLSILGNNTADRTALFLGACKGEGGQLWSIPNLPAADAAGPDTANP
jgi:glucosylceramidase